jgi:ankyrin repeat protein
LLAGWSDLIALLQDPANSALKLAYDEAAGIANIDMARINSVKLNPLHMAIMSGSCELVLLLLEHGADATTASTGNSELTTLELAQSPAMIKVLLAAGADVHAVNSKDGTTVLHNHAEAGTSGAAICTLLKAGADPTALDANGSSPAHIAGMSGHFALEALLSRAAEDYRKKHSSGAAGANVMTISSSKSGEADKSLNSSTM